MSVVPSELFVTFCCRSAAHFDITFHKIKGKDWVTLGMHLFDPFMRCMVTLATMDFEAAEQMSVDMILLFLVLVDKAVLKHCEESQRDKTIKFDPRWLIQILSDENTGPSEPLPPTTKSAVPPLGPI